jgi:hypothetical protein
MIFPLEALFECSSQTGMPHTLQLATALFLQPENTQSLPFSFTIKNYVFMLIYFQTG